MKWGRASRYGQLGDSLGEDICSPSGGVITHVQGSACSSQIVRKTLPSNDSSPARRHRSYPETVSFSSFCKEPMPVYLNVYALSIGCMKGAYHSGIECNNQEFAFLAEDGIIRHRPKQSPIGEYLDTYFLGHIQDWEIFKNAINDIKVDFLGHYYDLVHRNCNDFTNAACEFLFGRSIPRKINLLARVGRKKGVSRFLPFCCGLQPRKPWEEQDDRILART